MVGIFWGSAPGFPIPRVLQWLGTAFFRAIIGYVFVPRNGLEVTRALHVSDSP